MCLAPQVPTVPSLEVYESIMRLSQMVTQQMWERQNVMLQLPHIQQDMLRHFRYIPHTLTSHPHILTSSHPHRTRRRNITSMDSFVAMKNQDRRSLVRVLSDEDYLDVMAVCISFPHVTITTETQGTPVPRDIPMM